MSKSAELTRKDMKEPDKFQVAAGEAASWLTGHRRTAVLTGGVVVVALLVIVTVTTYREHQAALAGDLLSEVYRAADGQLSPVPLPGQPGPFFADEAARQQAVIAAAVKVLAAVPSTHAAALASVAKGDAHLKLGELDQAAAAYQAYLSSAPKEDSFRLGALSGLAVVEEGKGNADGALAAWTRLGVEVPAQADRADLEKARLLAAAGKAAEAKVLLAGFAEAHKGSTLVAEAQDRLARLGDR
jgi:tetratricopeptide (TPR) repeat protein